MLSFVEWLYKRGFTPDFPHDIPDLVHLHPPYMVEADEFRLVDVDIKQPKTLAGEVKSTAKAMYRQRSPLLLMFMSQTVFESLRPYADLLFGVGHNLRIDGYEIYLSSTMPEFEIEFYTERRGGSDGRWSFGTGERPGG